MINKLTVILFLIFYGSVIFSQNNPEPVPPIFSKPIDSLIDNHSSTIAIGLGNGTYSVTGSRLSNNFDVSVNANIHLGKSYYFYAGVDAYEGFIHEKITMIYLGSVYKFLFYEKNRNAVSLKLGLAGIIGGGHDGAGFSAEVIIIPGYDYWISRNFTLNADLRTHIFPSGYIFNPVLSISLHL